MTRSSRIGLAGAALTMLLAPALARADGGTITFSGAVVAPTCAVNAARISAVPPRPRPYPAPTSQRFACGQTDVAADAGRVYALTEVSLDAFNIDGDRVLAYFANYLGAAGVSGAKLVTQTYE